MLDGVWYTKPKDIKSAFLDFYKDKFSCHDSLVSFPPMLLAHCLSISDRDFLESMVFMDEIKATHDIQSFVVRFFSTGSPTSKFSLKRCLRQGDPLSPFLFIIVMEGLYMALNDGLAANMFHGVKVGSSDMHLSHLFYADDVIILLEWNLNSMKNVIRILNIFYIVFGLKINIHKSNVYGVGVLSDEVRRPTFSLLVAALLSSSMCSVALNILASLDKEGLGVGSLKAFNMSILLKSRWRLFHNLNALCVHVVKAIHGDEAGINIRGCHTNGVWANISLSHDDKFSVNSVRKHIDELSFPSLSLNIDSILCPVLCSLPFPHVASEIFGFSHGTPQMKRRTTLTPSLLLPVELMAV
ncbi:RNA-directed DNA polymerase, eukaryota, reverse transcriptase zinc-binding domain protein [Tanacetum coccineum]